MDSVLLQYFHAPRSLLCGAREWRSPTFPECVRAFGRSGPARCQGAHQGPRTPLALLPLCNRSSAAQHASDWWAVMAEEPQITLYKYSGAQWNMPSICPGCMTAEVTAQMLSASASAPLALQKCFPGQDSQLAARPVLWALPTHRIHRANIRGGAHHYVEDGGFASVTVLLFFFSLLPALRLT